MFATAKSPNFTYARAAGLSQGRLLVSFPRLVRWSLATFALRPLGVRFRHGAMTFRPGASTAASCGADGTRTPRAQQP